MGICVGRTARVSALCFSVLLISACGGIDGDEWSDEQGKAELGRDDTLELVSTTTDIESIELWISPINEQGNTWDLHTHPNVYLDLELSGRVLKGISCDVAEEKNSHRVQQELQIPQHSSTTLLRVRCENPIPVSLKLYYSQMAEKPGKLSLYDDDLGNDQLIGSCDVNFGEMERDSLILTEEDCPSPEGKMAVVPTIVHVEYLFHHNYRYQPVGS